MKKVEEQWIYKFLKSRFNYSTKTLGTYLWVATKCGKEPLNISWLGLRAGTGLSIMQIRACLNQLKRAGIVKTEHTHKTPIIVIYLMEDKNE